MTSSASTSDKQLNAFSIFNQLKPASDPQLPRHSVCPSTVPVCSPVSRPLLCRRRPRHALIPSRSAFASPCETSLDPLYLCRASSLSLISLYRSVTHSLSARIGPPLALPPRPRPRRRPPRGDRDGWSRPTAPRSSCAASCSKLTWSLRVPIRAPKPSPRVRQSRLGPRGVSITFHDPHRRSDPRVALASNLTRFVSRSSGATVGDYGLSLTPLSVHSGEEDGVASLGCRWTTLARASLNRWEWAPPRRPLGEGGERTTH